MVTVYSVNCLKALSLDVKLLKALPNCSAMASLPLFQNECPLKGMAVVASDLLKLSNKIAFLSGIEWKKS